MDFNIQIAFDCADPHAQAAFWAAALGYEVVDSDGQIKELLESGVATEDDVTTIDGRLAWRTGSAAVDPKGTRPRLYFQLVAEEKVVKNRVHFDVHLGPDEDRDAVVARLEELGATRLYLGEQGPHSWWTMADPEGNEFCVAG